MGNLTTPASPTWRRPLDAALDYAERGWHVLPCHTPVGNGRCTCGHQDCASIGKHPKLARGLHAASADPDQIREWWKRWPSANVAIRTGAPSGLVVLDIDPQHGGKDSLQHLIRQHGTPPSGPVVRTGSGGWHLYYTHPGGTIPNSASTLGPGLDLRGDGGYIIAPPSQHANGHTYTWTTQTTDIPTIPPWMHPQPVARPWTPSLAPTRPGAGLTAWAQAALDAESRRVANAAPGTRNATLNRAAFNLGRLAAAGILDQSTIRHELEASAHTAGLSQRETQRTLDSGLAAGAGCAPTAPRHGRGVETF